MGVSVWLAGIPQLSGFFGVSEKLVCGSQKAPGIYNVTMREVPQRLVSPSEETPLKKKKKKKKKGFQDLGDLDAEGLLALAGRHPQ